MLHCIVGHNRDSFACSSLPLYFIHIDASNIGLQVQSCCLTFSICKSPYELRPLPSKLVRESTNHEAASSQDDKFTSISALAICAVVNMATKDVAVVDTVRRQRCA
ncbi:hypothetical protein Hypma_011185 [Hypsizygus marmoreus]|uniref:Uncharacterized protein n=1 Tax=Hypsizygus marmoreus TaxID=39966 RepID=A0A369JJR1_HYPMA|nr:hypothetical protein Hypma_011185 [Hypsizygus marmoreus]